MVQVSDDGSLDTSGSSGHGKKWTDIGCILETEPTESAHWVWGKG